MTNGFNFGLLTLIMSVFCFIVLVILLIKSGKENDPGRIGADDSRIVSSINSSVQQSVKNMGDVINSGLRSSAELQARHISENLDKSAKVMESYIRMSEDRFRAFSEENSRGLAEMRGTIDGKLDEIRQGNEKKLDEMRSVVDEKLQNTLNRRLNESFSLVTERLEQVHEGLGEMKNLADGVGDLRKVLSNVKTRGILGEYQLANIMEEILAPEQYDTNVATKKGSSAVVEFAVKIPSENGFSYLPVDAKFPGDTYARLRDAIDSGSQLDINEASKLLATTIKSEAKDIRDKYIDPPNTTDFAIMFLPFEGLYAEVVNRGMLEVLQREYSVNIAGPSTMAALLNSLQMGFRAFAIQKRSSEVWSVLSAVKTEFGKFEKVLTATQQRINQANDELDRLVGVRTRQIQRKLKSVSELDDYGKIEKTENPDSEENEGEWEEGD